MMLNLIKAPDTLAEPFRKQEKAKSAHSTGDIMLRVKRVHLESLQTCTSAKALGPRTLTLVNGLKISRYT